VWALSRPLSLHDPIEDTQVDRGQEEASIDIAGDLLSVLHAPNTQLPPSPCALRKVSIEAGVRC